jgi:hypothetical protein
MCAEDFHFRWRRRDLNPRPVKEPVVLSTCLGTLGIVGNQAGVYQTNRHP